MPQKYINTNIRSCDLESDISSLIRAREDGDDLCNIDHVRADAKPKLENLYHLLEKCNPLRTVIFKVENHGLNIQLIVGSTKENNNASIKKQFMQFLTYIRTPSSMPLPNDIITDEECNDVMTVQDLMSEIQNTWQQIEPRFGPENLTPFSVMVDGVTRIVTPKTGRPCGKLVPLYNESSDLMGYGLEAHREPYRSIPPTTPTTQPNDKWYWLKMLVIALIFPPITTVGVIIYLIANDIKTELTTSTKPTTSNQ